MMRLPLVIEVKGVASTHRLPSRWRAKVISDEFKEFKPMTESKGYLRNIVASHCADDMSDKQILADRLAAKIGKAITANEVRTTLFKPEVEMEIKGATVFGYSIFIVSKMV
jgi:hypothetical protein